MRVANNQKNSFDTPGRVLNMRKTFRRCPGRLLNVESSHQRCSLRKGVLRNFAKIQRKTPSQSILFNKVGGLRPATLLNK